MNENISKRCVGYPTGEQHLKTVNSERHIAYILILHNDRNVKYVNHPLNPKIEKLQTFYFQIKVNINVIFSQKIIESKLTPPYSPFLHIRVHNKFSKVLQDNNFLILYR